MILEFENEKQNTDDSSSDSKKAGKGTSIGKEIVSWVLTFGAAIGIALLLKNFVIINATVPTGSMENTIMPKDNLFGFRLAYLRSDPKRGDIIIFPNPDDETQKYIKRIIGLPGEKVTIQEGKVYISKDKKGMGELLEEDYLKEEWTVNTGPYEFEVPENAYFVMGDNRNHSTDARFWKNTYVSRDKIIGKAVFIYFPFSHMKSL